MGEAPVLHWHFYAANHGHSLCDAHAGRVKTVLKVAQRNAQHCAGGAYGVGSVPITAGDQVLIINEAVDKTDARVIPPIKRPKRPYIPQIKFEVDQKGEKNGITAFYSFRF